MNVGAGTIRRNPPERMPPQDCWHQDLNGDVELTLPIIEGNTPRSDNGF
jgi:hypothetical protein